MIPLIVAKYAGKHIKKKPIMSPAKWAILGGALLGCIMLLMFGSATAEEPGQAIISMDGDVPLVQSMAAARYVAVNSPLASGMGGSTNVDLSEAYIDASEAVPSYNSAMVKNTGTIVLGVNSPTKAPAAEAYVVNLVPLLNAEMQELINFEESLGVTGHEEAQDYTLEQLKFGVGCIVNNGYGKYNSGGYGGVIGGVGPAITIRDFYTNNGQKDWGSNNWNCFSTKEHFVDLMFVSNSDVEKYLSGTSVDVKYLQAKLVDCKAHCAPWGVNQTYFYMNHKTGEMQPQHDAGSPASLCVGGAPQGGDEQANLRALLSVAKKNESSPGVYIWPTLKATEKDLGMHFKVNPVSFHVPAYTWNVFEGDCSAAAGSAATAELEDYTLVGVLVYAG